MYEQLNKSCCCCWYEVKRRIECFALHYLGAEPIEEGKPELNEEESHVLVQRTLNHNAVTYIRVSPMDNQQSFEMSKLLNGIIARTSCLRTFIAVYSHAYVGLLDHTHVVGSISYRQTYFPYFLLYQPYYLGFLEGRHSIIFGESNS